MNFILFDDERYFSLLPLTHTRPVGSLRCGIFTMKERWEHITISELSFKTQAHLQAKFPLLLTNNNVFINGALFHSIELFEAIVGLKLNECLVKDNQLLAVRLNEETSRSFDITTVLSTCEQITFNGIANMISQPWDIFSKNDWAIRYDFELLTKGKQSQALDASNTLIGDQIFIETGATVSCSILNATTGPIYIGRDAEIMEGSIVRGPLAMCEHSVLKMGAKIYGATTLGPGCKVGGEVNNALFYANSSKAHDGFVGNSVIGEWCNLGADSNNSNLKNNYEEVKLWNEQKQSFVKTGLQFCGLIMGDHSKCGINTMFNTGTVVGVSCNIFGAGFPRNFIPSFSWGGAQGYTEYKFNKAIETARKVFERRNIHLDHTEESMLQHVFDITSEQRKY